MGKSTNRLLTAVITSALLSLVWVASNSLGVTDTFNEALDVGIPDGPRIPGADHFTSPPPAGDERGGATLRASREQKATVDSVDAAAALATLRSIPVKGRAPKTGYSREQFGDEWSDEAEGRWQDTECDTRNDELAHHLVEVTRDADDCVVKTGILLYDPYSGQLLKPFDRAKGTSGDHALDIEHIVSLGNAWVTGAQALSEDERERLANEDINLMPVNTRDNRAKGDADYATWLPPNRSYRCAYAATQIEVKAEFHLWVTPAEKDAMVRDLERCA